MTAWPRSRDQTRLQQRRIAVAARATRDDFRNSPANRSHEIVAVDVLFFWFARRPREGAFEIRLWRLREHLVGEIARMPSRRRDWRIHVRSMRLIVRGCAAQPAAGTVMAAQRAARADDPSCAHATRDAAPASVGYRRSPPALEPPPRLRRRGFRHSGRDNRESQRDVSSFCAAKTVARAGQPTEVRAVGADADDRDLGAAPGCSARVRSA